MDSIVVGVWSYSSTTTFADSANQIADSARPNHHGSSFFAFGDAIHPCCESRRLAGETKERAHSYIGTSLNFSSKSQYSLEKLPGAPLIVVITAFSSTGAGTSLCWCSPIGVCVVKYSYYRGVGRCFT